MAELIKFEKTKAHQVYKCVDGGRVPGGSTIAGVAMAYWGKGPLMQWAWKEGHEGRDFHKTRDQAADTGTLAHWLVELHVRSILDGKEYKPDMSDFTPAQAEKAESAFLHFLEWFDREKVVPIASELQLVSEVYRFGGTIDLLVRRQGRDGVTLVDLKTSNGIYDEHRCQVAGYTQLAVENKYPITDSVVFRIGKDDATDDWEVYEIHDINRWWGVFKAGLGLYKAVAATKDGK